MRAKAELDYPEMAERSHYTMRTLASAAGGLRLPTLPVTVAYVRACGGTQAEVTEWEDRWQRLAQGRGKEEPERPALPAGSADEGSAGEGAPTAGPGPVSAPPKAGEIYVITSAKSRDDDEW